MAVRVEQVASREHCDVTYSPVFDTTGRIGASLTFN
jgi:hypothetical protein